MLRDRHFLGLWTLNFLFVAAGYSLINLLPPFLRDHSHITEREIGFIFFFNTITIVLVQLPMSRWLEGKRRLRALALMPFLWALAWLGVDATGYWLVGTAAFVVVVVVRDRVRRRRVLPRPRAPGARRRARQRPPARPLLRPPLACRGGSAARPARRSAG